MSGVDQAIHVTSRESLLPSGSLRWHQVLPCGAIQRGVELGQRCLRTVCGIEGEKFLRSRADSRADLTVPQSPRLGLPQALLLTRVIRHVHVSHVSSRAPGSVRGRIAVKDRADVLRAQPAAVRVRAPGRWDVNEASLAVMIYGFRRRRSAGRRPGAPTGHTYGRMCTTLPERDSSPGNP